MLETSLKLSDYAELAESKKIRRRLDFIYEPIPSFSCFDWCSACCFNAAETHLSEFANIIQYMRTMPADQRDAIIRRTVLYEFLHLVTLDHKCPFLEEGKCAVYEVRPLQCRFFGLYPDEDYDQRKSVSAQANKALLKEYKKNQKMQLPAEVVTYDIDQCDAARQSDNYLIVSSMEREAIEGRIVTTENDLMSDVDDEVTESEGGATLERFTLLYISNCMSAIDMGRLRQSAMKEYQETKTHGVLDSFIAMGIFELS